MKQQLKNIAENKGFPDNSELASLLDYEQGIRYSLNDEDFYMDVLKTYVTNNRLMQLEDAYKEEDWEHYIVAVHAVKGTTKTIGGEELSIKAKELEYSAKAGDYDYVKNNHEEVYNQYKRLIELVKEYLGI